MTGDEIAIGDAIACQERESGQFGVLHIEPEQIWVEFIGFGKCPSINADAPIYLHTAKGWVSMHPLFKAYLELRKERGVATASSGARSK